MRGGVKGRDREQTVSAQGAGWRHDLPGESFSSFYERYGASCRTKHLLVLPPSVPGRLGFAARLLFGRLETTNKRLYAPPARSSLPLEFIRLDPWEAEYLYLLAQTANRGIVEIGRFRGGSTFLLSCANRQVPIWSIDLHPADDELLELLFQKHRTGENVQLLVGDSHEDPFPDIGEFDLLFVDGDHTREGCLADLENFVPRLARGGHLVLHDCYAEFQVQQAVLEFARDTELEVIRSPYNINSHWHTSAGSIAHFAKPEGSR
jgi:predicted O-methyltransferase YrrM